MAHSGGDLTATSGSTASSEGMAGGSLLINFLDDLDGTLGAGGWPFWVVALGSLLFHTAVAYLVSSRERDDGGKLVVHWKWNVQWHFVAHAFISGVGAVLCVYLDIFHAETISGTPEPLRTIQCKGPLTWLHKVVPAFTLGYTAFDVVYGFSNNNMEYVLHGGTLGAVLLLLCVLDHQHAITPMLIMEVSSVPLNMRTASFLTDTGKLITQAVFALTFFVIRIFIVPYIWWKFVKVIFRESKSAESSCYPPYFKYVVVGSGLIFHGLNLYWWGHIFRVIRRKLRALKEPKEKES